jgi:hypothetical protein
MNILNIYVLFLVPYTRHAYLLTLRSAPFAPIELLFFGYVVTPQGIEVDEAKIEAIKAGRFLQLSHNFRVFLAL